ncbi:uncharacterized protein DMAD_00521 [Drosophila madeirensis]|uniref:Uncharacterized protein n=1 Tax=Drosophila madeirensis TaxID=30013 RepID=A0AAU9FXW8_DROMD
MLCSRISRFPGPARTAETQLEWNRPPFELCDEWCMLMAFIISICEQFLLMEYIAFIFFSPFTWRNHMHNVRQRQRYSKRSLQTFSSIYSIRNGLGSSACRRNREFD